MSDIETNAALIALEAHKGQRRKWGSQDPYIVHPTRVANKVRFLPGMTEVDIAAALLHDVIEDCDPKWIEVIRQKCGEEVLQLVLELTNPTAGPEWKYRPRAEKRAKDWEHLAQVSDRAKRIKLVDRWDNLGDFVNGPKKLIAKYIQESRHLVGMIGYVDETLAKEVEERINALSKALS